MIEIYGTPVCSYCNLAKKLCDEKGLGYQYIDLFEDPEALTALRARVGEFKTVPQIIFDGEHIGGFEQLKEKVNEG